MSNGDDVVVVGTATGHALRTLDDRHKPQKRQKRLGEGVHGNAGEISGIDTPRAQLDALTMRNGALSADNNTLRAQIETLSADNNTLRAQIETLTMRNGALSADNDALAKESVSLKTRVKSGKPYILG